MKHKIAILGASYLQLPLIEKAKDMNIETHCFAWDNDYAVCKYVSDYFYPISVLDKEIVLRKCKEINIDGITTIATDICVPTISYVASKMNLTANSIQASLLSTNKFLMRQAFEKQKLSSPKSICVESFDDLDFKDLNFPMIVKPTDRSGSRGVKKAESIDELKKGIFNALKISFENKAIVEEFIDGIEVSVESISWKGKHYVLAVTDKVTTNHPHFVEIEHHQPSSLDDNLIQNIKTETHKVLNALGIEYGASHTEYKITKDGNVFIIETGARMGGDFIGSNLIELSTGYDYIKGVIEIALGYFNEPILQDLNFSGVYFLSRETEHLLPYFNSKNKFDIKKSIQNINLENLTNSNDRSGYLIYKSDKKINL